MCLKFCTAGCTDALGYAVDALKKMGCEFAPTPDSSVTHLLLPCPAFDEKGLLRGGGDLEDILQQLPKNVTVMGGRLPHPALQEYTCKDLLQDADYLAENAMITAHCAVKVALRALPVTLKDQPVLVAGWGRIGKCLAKLLRDMGARVTLSARKESDMAMIRALGYDAMDPAEQGYRLIAFRVIFNTVPEMIFPKDILQYSREDCLKIDLASLHGMDGNDVIVAKGLPNQEAPESSGNLIAKTVLRLRGVTQ